MIVSAVAKCLDGYTKGMVKQTSQLAVRNRSSILGLFHLCNLVLRGAQVGAKGRVRPLEQGISRRE